MASPLTTSKELKKLKAENAKLKAENNRLEEIASELKNKKKGHKNPRRTARKIAIIALVAFATILLVLGNLLFWFGNTIVKQDRFIAATEPIIKDAAVQQSMALYATNSIFNAVDVQKVTEEVLPPRAAFLAPQLATQLKSTTESTLQKALARPSLQDKWNSMLSTQHDRLINFASQYTGSGVISLNDIYSQLSATLKETKLSFLSNKTLPANVGKIEVINASWLPTFHKVVTNIDTWRLLSLITFAAAVILAMWLSRNKRKTLYIISVTASIFMLVSLIAIRLARETIAQKVDPQYQEGVRSALQIVFHSLAVQTITIVLALLLLAFIAWISSGSRNATALKGYIALLFSGKLHDKLFGDKTNPFTNWVRQNKRFLEWTVVAVITTIMLLARLTVKTLILYAFLMLIFVLAIEVIGGGPNSKPRHKPPK